MPFMQPLKGFARRLGKAALVTFDGQPIKNKKFIYLKIRIGFHTIMQLYICILASMTFVIL